MEEYPIGNRLHDIATAMGLVASRIDEVEPRGLSREDCEQARVAAHRIADIAASIVGRVEQITAKPAPRERTKRKVGNLAAAAEARTTAMISSPEEQRWFDAAIEVALLERANGAIPYIEVATRAIRDKNDKEARSRLYRHLKQHPRFRKYIPTGCYIFAPLNDGPLITATTEEEFYKACEPRIDSIIAALFERDDFTHGWTTLKAVMKSITADKKILDKKEKDILKNKLRMHTGIKWNAQQHLCLHPETLSDSVQ